MSFYEPIEQDEAVGLIVEGMVAVRSRQIFNVKDQAVALIDGLQSLGFFICAVEALETGDD